ncbi:MAG: shufflon system plasmid conjugative transfer pilus tip adhesin PilV [Patescibacteria group bacterium]
MLNKFLNKEFSILSVLVSVLILSTIVGFGIHLIFAWTGPTTNPPDGNVAIPLNASSAEQTKSGALSIDGGLKVDGSVVIDGDRGWHRTYGATGWYNETYAGGWYMLDTNWVRSYNNKGVYTGGQMKADGGFCIGASCVTSWPSGGSTGGGFVWKSSPSAMSWTCDDAWHDYDATSITSANAKGIIISMKSGGGRWMYIYTRSNGSSSDREGFYSHDDDNNYDDGGMIIQGTDAGQIFEYKCAVEGNPNPRIVGYFE